MKTSAHKQLSPSIRFAPYLLETVRPGIPTLWLDRQRQRLHLSRLNPHLLEDIGISRIMADKETRRSD